MGMPIQFTKVLVTPTGTSIAAVQAHAAAGAVSVVAARAVARNSTAIRRASI